MKWNLKLLLVVLLPVFFFGCFGMKKIKTVTVTETVIRIDTIIKIQTDTILKIQTVTLHDTAILENNTAIARSYFSTSKQRIVLELKGKTFDVPITVYKSVKQVEVQKEKVKEQNKIGKYFIAFILGCIVFMLIRDRKEIFKK